MVSVTDAHVHVVSSDTDRFPLRPADFGRDWWSGRAVDSAQITRDLDAANVEQAVIVQAVGPYRNDNRYAQHVVAAAGGRFALVAAIDSDGSDPAAELATLAEGGVDGVRVAAFAAEAPWLTDNRGAAIWEVAAERGMNLVVACLAHHLPAVAQLASARPDVVVTLDHCAFPDLGGGLPYLRAAPLFDTARLPAINLKVTTIVLRQAEQAGGARAFVARLVDTFGAERVCWGSDHPQTFEVDYPQMVQLALDATSTLDDAARDAVLHATANRLWFGSD